MKSSAPDKLLTISIPTYNREPYLDLCLSQFWKQIQPFQDQIEFIVSDNCSTDNTPAIVQKYIEKGFEIKYIRNEINLGADGNFEQCFRLATSKYFWLFCDDDFILNDSIKPIIELLKSNDFGNVYLEKIGFIDKPEELINNVYPFNFRIYKNLEDFLIKVNIQTTFASGTIINKSILYNNLDSKKYYGTSLVHVNWNINTLILSKESAIVQSPILAYKGGNTGGYALFKTFAINLRMILKNEFKRNNINLKLLSTFDKELLVNFFPIYILASRDSEKYQFIPEDAESILDSQYSGNMYYKILNKPLFYLPKNIAKMYYKIFQKTIKLIN